MVARNFRESSQSRQIAKRTDMNLLKIFRTVVAISLATLGLVSQSQAAVTAFFSTTPDCVGASSAFFSPGGPTVQVSLCMTTTPSTATCGHTIVLQAATAPESNKFVITSSTLGAGYSDPNSEVAQLPLAITNPPIIADLGGTGSAPVQATANQLLATFSLAPQSGATNASYVISLNNVSVAAVDADGTCGATTVPSDAAITASFTLNRNNAPAFTSANSTTFSTTGTNSFTIAATGNPAPTLSSGTLPGGVLFNAGTGVLSGNPVAGGPYAITFTASNGVQPDATQSFSLTAAGQAGQMINFTNPGSRTFSSTPIPLTATASPSGLTVTFGTQTPSICSVVGANVTMLTLGTCTIVASQIGNATYLPAAQVFQSFGIAGTVPGAPTIGTGTAGDGQAIITFTPPTATGGLSISNYTASCAGQSATGRSSPITVTLLANNPATPYLCSVTATNSLGTGPASATVSVTPTTGTPLVALGIKSRKTHTAVGVFDLAIDTTQPFTSVTTEPRLVGAGHVIVFQFNNPITTVAAATATAVDHLGAPIGGTPTITFVAGSSEVLVTFIAAIPDKSRLTLTLSNVNGAGTSVPVSMGFLAGDVNNNRAVNVGDVLGTSARSGNPLDQNNFRFDFNLNGAINVGDVLGISARSGNNLN